MSIDQLANNNKTIVSSVTCCLEEATKQIFPDDIWNEIMSMIDNSWFVLNNCSFISKQFYQVIKESVKLNLCFKKKLYKERIELLRKCQLMNNIVNIQLGNIVIEKNALSVNSNFLTEMKQLKTLGINENRIGDEGVKYLSELSQLT